MSLYDTLGIDKDATKDDIKSAYRRAAHKYHPDKNNGDAKKFHEVAKAYAVLSDDEKKEKYDKTGETEQVDIDKQAEGELITLFFNIIDTNPPEKLNRTNIISFMNKSIKKVKKDIVKEIKKINKRKKYVQKINKRIKGKSDRNIFKFAIEAHLRQLRRNAVMMSSKLKVYNKQLEILRDYDCDIEKEINEFVSTRSYMGWLTEFDKKIKESIRDMDK